MSSGQKIGQVLSRTRGRPTSLTTDHSGRASGRPFSVRALIAVLAFVLVSVTAGAGSCFADDELAQRFMSEAPAQWDAYDTQYQKLQGDYELRMLSDQQEVMSGVITITCNSECRAVTYHYTMPSARPDDAYVYNARYAFSVSRKQDQQDWTFRTGATMKSLQGSKSESILGRMIASPQQNVLTSLQNITLKDLIASREFEIKEAVWDEIDGFQHVRVTFSTPHVYGVDDRDNPFQSGVLWLNPNRYWTIRRATAVMEMPQYRSEITFERPESDPSSPAPIPGATSVTRVTTSTNDQLGGTVVEETVYNLSFDHPTPSNSEFTLRAFGLDELDALAEQEAPQSEATWPWMAAFAIGSIALALAILWFKRKKR